jgi:hypothetical protein
LLSPLDAPTDACSDSRYVARHVFPVHSSFQGEGRHADRTGAGEALRGGINKFLDDAGEGIAGRSSTAGTTTTTTTAGDVPAQAVKRGDGGVSSADVANNGVNEVQRGMDALRR